MICLVPAADGIVHAAKGMVHPLTVVPSNVVNVVTIDLKPGDYGIWCFFPDKQDHKPHALHGMMQQIKIS